MSGLGIPQGVRPCSVVGCRRDGEKTGSIAISPSVDARPEVELVVHLCTEHVDATRDPAGWKIFLAYDRTSVAPKMDRLVGFLEAWGVTTS